jgi:hypothetical protein
MVAVIRCHPRDGPMVPMKRERKAAVPWMAAGSARAPRAKQHGHGARQECERESAGHHHGDDADQDAVVAPFRASLSVMTLMWSSFLPSANRENGARRGGDDTSGDAADEEEARHTRSAMGAHHEEIGFLRLRRLGDVLVRHAVEQQPPHAGTRTLRLRQQGVELLLRPQPDWTGPVLRMSRAPRNPLRQNRAPVTTRGGP